MLVSAIHVEMGFLIVFDGRSVSAILFPSLLSEVHLPVQLFCKRDIILMFENILIALFKIAGNWLFQKSIFLSQVCGGGGGGVSWYVGVFPGENLPILKLQSLECLNFDSL